MTSQVSPGVVVNEFDFSDYAERIATAIFGVVGWANRGEEDTVTLVTNERQLIETFGRPEVETDTDIAAITGETTAYRSTGLVAPAQHYLRQGNQCLCVRVASSSILAYTTLVKDGVPETTFTFTALTKGTWPAAAKENVEFRISDATKGGNYFKLEIRSRNIIRETYDNLLSGSDIGTDTDNAIEERINGVSQFVTVSDDATRGRPLNTTGWLASGANGGTTGNDGGPSDGLGAGDFSGLDLNNNPEGLTAFEDSDTVDVNILAAPGVNSDFVDTARVVHLAGIAVAEKRGDAIYLIDSEAEINQITGNGSIQDFANGNDIGTTYTGDAFNSSYAALYWPWVKVFDTFNDVEAWASPSGLVAGVYAFNDRATDASWFAPAGFNRGKIRNALAIIRNTTLGERETLYASGEVINPIVNFPGEGITVWGQKTTQRKNTALNRVNVRRMLNFAKKVIATSVKFLVFEPNDKLTYRRFIQITEPVLDSIKARRGIFDFRVICDETTNPPALVDQNQMRGIILLKPTKTAEVITIDFTLLSTGAQFNEFIEAG